MKRLLGVMALGLAACSSPGAAASGPASSIAPSGAAPVVVDGIGIGPEVSCEPICELMEAAAASALASRTPSAAVESIAWHQQRKFDANGHEVLATRSGIFVIALVTTTEGSQAAVAIGCGVGDYCWEVTEP